MKLFNIPFRIDWSWYFFVGINVFFAYPNQNEMIFTACLFLGAYFCVTLHELAHCYVAIRNGHRIERITLSIFGGAAIMDPGDFENSKNRLTEFWITVVGPLTNFLISFAITICLMYNYSMEEVDAIIKSKDPNVLYSIDSFWMAMAAINFMIGAFNLLPVFPMDGGRIVRSVLNQLTKDYHKSTKITCWIALCMAPAMAIVFFFVTHQYIAGVIMLLFTFANYNELKSITKKKKPSETVFNFPEKLTVFMTRDMLYIGIRNEIGVLSEKEIFGEWFDRFEPFERVYEKSFFPRGYMREELVQTEHGFEQTLVLL